MEGFFLQAPYEFTKIKNPAKRQKGKVAKIRNRKGKAILIQTSGNNYAEVVKSIKKEVDPDKISAIIKTLRKTRAGEVLIELGQGNTKTSKLKNELESINLISKVRRLGKEHQKTTPVIKEIEEEATEGELPTAFCNSL